MIFQSSMIMFHVDLQGCIPSTIFADPGSPKCRATASALEADRARQASWMGQDAK